MEETSEDKILRKKIEQHTKPLQDEISKLREQVKILSKTQEDDRESLIKDILKRSSLYTRYKVFLEMQYLTLTIQPDRPATDEEWQQAYEWADETTVYLIESLLRWEKDGRPALYPNDKG